MNQLQQSQKQMQLHGIPPNSNSTSGWYRSPEMICQSFTPSDSSSMPERYMMVSSGGGRTMTGYYRGAESGIVQKMPANLLPADYGQPTLALHGGPPQAQNFVTNGMMPKMMGQNNAGNMNMMLESSVPHPHTMVMAGTRSQVVSPTEVMNPSNDIYQDQRMVNACHPLYQQQQFAPGHHRGQVPVMDDARMQAGGPAVPMGTELNRDVMLCRMSGGDPNAMRGHLPVGSTSYSSQQQRVMPYPNPQQYMQNKRAQYRERCKMFSFDSNAMQAYGVNGYGNGWPRQMMPSPQSVTSNGYQCLEMPCHVKEEPGSYVQMGVPGQYQPPMWDMPRPSRDSVQMNTFSPPPGNPTPPMTPGSSSQPCHMTPNMTSDVRSNGSRSSLRDSEQCFTFSVRDGMVKAPFQLEHNRPVSLHVFNLRDDIHESLMRSNELDLMLKCFHKDDRSSTTNWPMTVSISLNDILLPIDRGNAPFVHHQPLFLKSACKPGQNSLQISVQACCCSHLFMLQIVQRPTVRSVLHGLLTKRLLPAPHAINKAKRFMSQMSMSFAGSSNDPQPVSLSLTCPITSQRIVLPARGRDCRHIQCFDLESFLKVNCNRNHWICPICKKAALLDGLEVDQYFWGILIHLSSASSDRVLLDTSANWKPIPPNGMDFSSDANQCKKFISVECMVLPNLNTCTLSNMPGNYGTRLPPGGGTNTHADFSVHERNQKPMPNEVPNYLGCLSQMADGFLAESNSSPGAGALLPGNGLEHVSFPPTPMGSQISQICTPLDGQSLHPRTPSDGNSTNPHTPPDGGHPYTPLDSTQQLKTSSSETRAQSLSTASYDACSARRAPGQTVTESGGSSTALFSGGSVVTGQQSGEQKLFFNSQDQLTQMNGEQSTRMRSPLLSDVTSLDFKSNFTLEALPEIDNSEQDVLNLFPDIFDDDPCELNSYLGPDSKQPTKSISPTTSKENDEFLSFLT